jgi:hypothetical protein
MDTRTTGSFDFLISGLCFGFGIPPLRSSWFLARRIYCPDLLWTHECPLAAVAAKFTLQRKFGLGP